MILMLKAQYIGSIYISGNRIYIVHSDNGSLFISKIFERNYLLKNCKDLHEVFHFKNCFLIYNESYAWNFEFCNFYNNHLCGPGCLIMWSSLSWNTVWVAPWSWMYVSCKIGSHSEVKKREKHLHISIIGYLVCYLPFQ